MILLSLSQSLSLQYLFGAGGDDADDKRKESNNSGSMGSHCTAMLQLRWWINIKIMIITIDIIIVITLITSNDCNQAAMRRGGHNPTDIEVRREKRNIGKDQL